MGCGIMHRAVLQRLHGSTASVWSWHQACIQPVGQPQHLSAWQPTPLPKVITRACLKWW